MKQKRHCSIDEISAYIDGESETPEQTAEHILLCPECMKLHQELTGLSTHLKALQTADPGPAFVTRVTALAAEQNRGHWFRRHITLRLRFASVIALATCVICVGVFAFLHNKPSANTPNAPYNATRAIENDDNLADASLSDNEEDLTGEDLLESLAETDWSVCIATDWETDDVDAIINDMNQDEAEALVDVVREYAQEGLTI
jgi:hypothetical protein